MDYAIMDHYLSGPALSCYAMLNMTEVYLNLFQMLTWICSLRKGMRGGVSYVPKRYSKDNNYYLNSYDPKQESKHYIHRRE